MGKNTVVDPRGFHHKKLGYVDTSYERGSHKQIKKKVKAQRKVGSKRIAQEEELASLDPRYAAYRSPPIHLLDRSYNRGTYQLPSSPTEPKILKKRNKLMMGLYGTTTLPEISNTVTGDPSYQPRLGSGARGGSLQLMARRLAMLGI